MDDFRERFVQLVIPTDKVEEARKFGPLSEHLLFGRKVLLFRDADRDVLKSLGELQVPSVADVFVALMGGEA
jgi:ABC-2 type transport system ATP-binding protein